MEKIEVTENFIRIPVRSADDFVRESFRTIDISKAKGIKSIIGKLKSDPSGSTKVKTYLFDKEKWTLEVARTWVKENKSMKKYLQGYVEKAEDDGTLSVAIATDESVDRDGERIKADGWDFKNFKKNPVLLWAHDYRQEPIGKVLNIRKEGKKILFQPQFAIDISRKAREIFEFYKQGYLNTFSVGFIPKEWEMETKGDRDVRVYTKTEMLEISAVPVPSNPNAVVLARSKGLNNGIVDEMEDMSEIEKTADTGETMAPEGVLKNDIEGEKEKMDDPKEKTDEECEDCKKLKQNIETLKKSIAEKETVNGGESQVESLGVLLENPKITKRLLQEVDKHVGEALSKLKRAGIK